MKISILIPSKRPALLQQFIQSLKDTTSDFNNLELVILEDSNGEHMMYREDNFVRILHPKTEYVSERLYECFANSTGDWIMFGNDDLVAETRGWDTVVKHLVGQFPDEILMMYPDDTIFGRLFPCFPIISRKVLEMTNFFPLPKFFMYKVDDCLAHMIPISRVIYIPEVRFRHLNAVENEAGVNINEHGYKYYEDFGKADQKTFLSYLNKVMENRDLLEKKIRRIA